jgi:hypothetical protein
MKYIYLVSRSTTIRMLLYFTPIAISFESGSLVIKPIITELYSHSNTVTNQLYNKAWWGAAQGIGTNQWLARTPNYCRWNQRLVDSGRQLPRAIIVDLGRRLPRAIMVDLGRRLPSAIYG